MSENSSCPEIDKVAFEGPKTPDRGYTMRASYLREPHAKDALVEIFKDGAPARSFRFPAYKIFNLQAHFDEIVDGEVDGSLSGYSTAAWNGVGAPDMSKFDRARLTDPTVAAMIMLGRPLAEIVGVLAEEKKAYASRMVKTICQSEGRAPAVGLVVVSGGVASEYAPPRTYIRIVDIDNIKAGDDKTNLPT